MHSFAHYIWVIALVTCSVLLALFALSDKIRNLLGIGKDRVEKRKATLEVQKMESRIVSATDAEIERYDPKQNAIRRAATRDSDSLAYKSRGYAHRPIPILPIFLIAAVMLILGLLIKSCIH